MKKITKISLIIMPLILNTGYCSNSEVYKYSEEDTSKIGFCAGIFNIAASTSAYNNQEGPLRIYALQFGRAYTAYSAININKGKASMDAAKKINNDLFNYSKSAESYINAHPSNIAPQIDACSKLIDPIFANLVNSGVNVGEGGTDLTGMASEIADNKRKDLGFK